MEWFLRNLLNIDILAIWGPCGVPYSASMGTISSQVTDLIMYMIHTRRIGYNMMKYAYTDHFQVP